MAHLKEVQGVEPEREEQIDYHRQINIESKTVSILKKLNFLPEGTINMMIAVMLKTVVRTGFASYFL